MPGSASCSFAVCGSLFLPLRVVPRRPWPPPSSVRECGSVVSPWICFGKCSSPRPPKKPAAASPSMLQYATLTLVSDRADDAGWRSLQTGLPLFHGAQIAVCTTLVSVLRRDGTPHPRCVNEDGVGGRGEDARLRPIRLRPGGRSRNWPKSKSTFCCLCACFISVALVHIFIDCRAVVVRCCVRKTRTYPELFRSEDANAGGSCWRDRRALLRGGAHLPSRFDPSPNLCVLGLGSLGDAQRSFHVGMCCGPRVRIVPSRSSRPVLAWMGDG